MTENSAEPLSSLLEMLLAEQQQLQTPVAGFAASQKTAAAAGIARYERLIPLTQPGPGEQYAFEVDLDSCTGCKACVSACHSLNGLDENETWRDIGLLVGSDSRRPFAQTITTACHHCADPACLNGCPVLAYEKDPVTGIVRHLGDQCIGCTYCVLKCPYDVPKYNPARGIVRKCDMCQGRLGAGEAPACAQACPTQAIRIVTVPVNRARANSRCDTSQFLAAAPDPAYTQPTTRFVSNRVLPPQLMAADEGELAPQPAHWPLAVMLTLMALAVGAFDAAALASSGTSAFIAIGWLAGTAGLATSVLHLGRPLRAWRVFLGLRRSWLSREAVLLGIWLAIASAAEAAQWVAPRSGAAYGLIAAAALVGLGGLFTSVMVYVDTRRYFWRWQETGPRFFGSALVLGLATAVTIHFTLRSAILLAAAVAIKLGWEGRAARFRPDQPAAAGKTVQLLGGPLARAASRRRLLAFFGAGVVPLALTLKWIPQPFGWIGFAAILAGELSERYLFFRAVVAPKMPGTGPR